MDTRRIRDIVIMGCYLVLFGICLLLVVNVLRFSSISYDSGWNAQVALNYAKTGKYATTWPSDSFFHISITTGQTVLLPTALLFKLFGVSFETIAIVPMCFIIVFIFLLHTLIRENVVEILQENNKYIGRKSVLVNLISLFLLIAIWSIIGFSDYSYQLCGESATMCFIALGLIGIDKYRKKGSCLWLLLCGVAFVSAIITKLVSICFVFVALVVLMVYIMQEKKMKDVGSLIVGMSGTFFVLDFIKFQQLGYSIRKYFEWWKAYLKYNLILNQEDNNLTLIEKIFTYEEAFQLKRYWGALVLCLGIGILFCVGVKEVFKKRWSTQLSIYICGLGGVSYLIVSIFISKGGAMMTRRLVIHFTFFLLFLLFLAFQFVLEIWKQIVDYIEKKEINLKYTLVNLMGAIMICVSLVPAFFSGITNLVNIDIERRQQQEIMWEQVAKIAPKAKLVTWDWRFASAMSTLHELDIIHIEEVDFESDEKYYYISDAYLVQEILDVFEYKIIYQKDEETLKPCIIELVGWK